MAAEIFPFVDDAVVGSLVAQRGENEEPPAPLGWGASKVLEVLSYEIYLKTSFTLKTKVILYYTSLRTQLEGRLPSPLPFPHTRTHTCTNMSQFVQQALKGCKDEFVGLHAAFQEVLREEWLSYADSAS